MYYRVNVAELKKAMIDSGFNKVKDLSQATGVDRNTLGKILNEKLFHPRGLCMRWYPH